MQIFYFIHNCNFCAPFNSRNFILSVCNYYMHFFLSSFLFSRIVFPQQRSGCLFLVGRLIKHAMPWKVVCLYGCYSFLQLVYGTFCFPSAILLFCYFAISIWKNTQSNKPRLTICNLLPNCEAIDFRVLLRSRCGRILKLLIKQTCK